MQALVISRRGGPEVLELREVPDVQPGTGEVLINIEACGINFADILTTAGRYPGLPDPPLIAGREFSGRIASTGERVMGYTQQGAFAEKISAPGRLLWPVPDAWSAAEAAAFPVNFFTAYFAFWKAGLLEPTTGRGRRVLIHAVAGGVGTAAVQLGKLLELELYGTSSAEEKLQRVQKLGLQHPINYGQQDYEEAITSLTKGEGVDAVFEMLGGEHVMKSVRCLRDFGRVISYGSVTGQPGRLDVRPLYAKGTSVHGLWLTQLSKRHDLMDQAWKQLSLWVAQGRLRPVIGHILPMTRAADAYHLLLERGNFGKVILEILPSQCGSVSRPQGHELSAR